MFTNLYSSLEQQKQKLGLVGLISIVLGSIIGGGIFNISQNMAYEAGLGAILIAWGITGIGIFTIVLTFKILNKEKPELAAGIYSYAKAGFGRYAGFNSAWGYWLSQAIGNVIFAVMLNDVCGFYFPELLKHEWPTVIFGSCFIWAMTIIVIFGLRQVSKINTISTVIKFAAILFIILLLFIFADYDRFSFDFWGKESHLGDVAHQVKSTMIIAFWLFLGIEGAVIISDRAKKRPDVGKATVIGFLISFFLYASVSILSFGFLPQTQLATLGDPSVSEVLRSGVGEWAMHFVNISFMISVTGAWLVWAMLSAELPAQAAQDGVFPRFFARRNKKGSPVNALLITSAITQLFMFVVISAKDVYIAAVDITGIMILPTYIFSSGFLTKLSLQNRRWLLFPVGCTATLYCLWLLYTGIDYLLLSTVIYSAGIYFYYLAHREEVKAGRQLYTEPEKIAIGSLITLTLVALSLYIQGKITI